mgnify:CR=1 FL=1
METAKWLEASWAAGRTSESQFNVEYPQVPYITINAHYSKWIPIKLDEAVSNGTPDGTRIVLPGAEKELTVVTIQLCKGSGYNYVADDKRTVTDLLVGITVSETGRVSKIYTQPHTLPPFFLPKTIGVLDAFAVMEDYVNANIRHS